jgi:hypothetical protein
MIIACFKKILSRVRWHAWREWRILVRIIGFIGTLVTSLNYNQYRQYSVIVDIHIFQFTVTHALGFPVITSRLRATDLNTETITISLDYTLQTLHINKVFKSHFKSSQADLLYSFVLRFQFALQLRTEFTAHSSRYIASESTTYKTQPLLLGLVYRTIAYQRSRRGPHRKPVTW